MSGDFPEEANSPDNTELALNSETEDIIELGSDSESDVERGDLVSADIEGTDHDNEDHGSVSTDTEGSEVPLINAGDTAKSGNYLVPEGFKPVITYGDLEIVDRFEEEDEEEEEQQQEKPHEEQEVPEEHLMQEQQFKQLKPPEQKVNEELNDEQDEGCDEAKEEEEHLEQEQGGQMEQMEQEEQDEQVEHKEQLELQEKLDEEQLQQEEDEPADISHYLDTELQAWAGLDEVVPGSDDEQIASGPAGDSSSVPYADLEQLNSGQTPGQDAQLIQQTQNLDLDPSESHIQWTDEGCSPSTTSDQVSVVQEGSDIPSTDLSNQIMDEFDTNNSSVSHQMAPDDGVRHPGTDDPEEHPEQQPSEAMEDNDFSFHMDRNTGQILPFENLEIEIVLESDLARQNEHSTGTTAEQDQDKMVRKHLLII